jgi:hypothetical protein
MKNYKIKHAFLDDFTLTSPIIGLPTTLKQTINNDVQPTPYHTNPRKSWGADITAADGWTGKWTGGTSAAAGWWRGGARWGGLGLPCFGWLAGTWRLCARLRSVRRPDLQTTILYLPHRGHQAKSSGQMLVDTNLLCNLLTTICLCLTSLTSNGDPSSDLLSDRSSKLYQCMPSKAQIPKHQ